MAPSKRPAETAPDSAPATKKRGRPAKNSIEESATSRENAERILENKRAFRRENVDRYVGELIRLPGDGWSQAHENALDRMWRESEHSQAKLIGTEGQYKGRTTQPQLLKLFKVCLRVFEISPIRFLSFSYGLEYLGERGSSAIFSKAYSEALTGLIVHPAFEGKKNKLAAVIQYAVICRIDDRRPWPNTTSTLACPALAKMAKVMNESEDGESEDSIHRTHLEARSECEKEGNIPSKLSDLLFQVGKTVKKSTVKGIDVPDEMKEYRGQVVRPVSLYDLQHIKKTLDETTWPSESWNCTVAEALYSYQLAINQPEVPNAEELPVYYERAHKRKLRDWMLKSNFQPPQELEELDFDGIDQGGNPCGSQFPIVDAPNDLERASTPEPCLSVNRPLPVQTMAGASVQRPELTPERLGSSVNAGRGQGRTSPSKLELLAKLKDHQEQLNDHRELINDLQKRVAALETEKRKQRGNAASHEEAGRGLSGHFADMQFNPDLPIVPRLTSHQGRGQSEYRQSPLPHQLSRESSPVIDNRDDFQQSLSFTPAVKDGSIVETGIPRARVQRQQLNRVVLATTPITGVGCLKARSSSVARRTDKLCGLSYTDKVKNLLN